MDKNMTVINIKRIAVVGNMNVNKYWNAAEQ